MKKILAVIPARLNSKRLPQKPLISIAGKPLIQRVYEAIKDSPHLTKTIVATDNEKIFSCIQKMGGNAMITGRDHPTGSDRIVEVMERLVDWGETYDIILNVQGDELFVDSQIIEKLIAPFEREKDLVMTTLKRVISKREEIEDPNVVKVIVDTNHYALYFSRSAIPHQRDRSDERGIFYKHIGLYGYRPNFLKTYCQMPQTALEKIEKLEQLRVLENGYKIYVNTTPIHTLDINTMDNVKEANKNFKQC